MLRHALTFFLLAVTATLCAHSRRARAVRQAFDYGRVIGYGEGRADAF